MRENTSPNVLHVSHSRRLPSRGFWWSLAVIGVILAVVGLTTVIRGRDGWGISWATQEGLRCLEAHESRGESTVKYCGPTGTGEWVFMATSNTGMVIPGFMVVMIQAQGQVYRWHGEFNYALARAIESSASAKQRESFDSWIDALAEQKTHQVNLEAWKQVLLTAESQKQMDGLLILGFELVE